MELSYTPVSEMESDEKEIEQKMVKIVQQMPKEVQSRFKALKVLSDQRSQLNDKFEEEMKALEDKIAAKKKPLYDQRRKIISGEETKFEESVAKFEETMAKLEKESKEVVSKNIDAKEKGEEEIPEVDVKDLIGKEGIPQFWFKAMKNAQMIAEHVKEKDEEVLKHVTHVDSEALDKPEKTLSISMHFAENEFFDNNVLSVTLVYKKNSEEIERTQGTTINWKEGKDLTKKKIKKKQKHKKTNETRTIVKTVEADSFFNLFTSRQSAKEEDNLDEEEENQLMEKLDEQTNFVEDMNEVLIPDALEYYLGLNEDMYDNMGEEESGDEEEQESDEEGGSKKKKKKEGKKSGDQKECKQQ